MPRLPRLRNGRHKIEIKMIEDKNKRRVCFTKRRSGIFSKACALGSLFGAESLVIVFSQAGNAFTFGNPSVNSMIDRFLTGDPLLKAKSNSPFGTSHPTRAQELNEKLKHFSNCLRIAKEQGKKLKSSVNRMEKPIESLDFHELEVLKASMEQLGNNIIKRAMELNFKSGEHASF